MTRASRALLLSGLVAVSAACLSPLPAPSPGVEGTSVPPSAAVSGVPPATSQAQLDIEDLPLVAPDPATLTAICDPEPNQIDPDAGETSVICFDALQLGLRATRTASASTSRRAYLVRTRCDASGCPAGALDTATVVIWTDGGTFGVRIDSRLETVGIPEHVLVDPWPAANPFTSPAVKREELAGAPGSIASRPPYPSCGRAATDEADPLSCFRNLVLLGRPAEVVQTPAATEGGEVIDLFRFAGAGAITRYEQSEGRWTEQRGSMILGPVDGAWSFEPWDAGVVVR